MAEERLSLFLAIAVVFVAQFSASSSISPCFLRIVATILVVQIQICTVGKGPEEDRKFTRNFEVLFWFFSLFFGDVIPGAGDGGGGQHSTLRARNEACFTRETERSL